MISATFLVETLAICKRHGWREQRKISAKGMRSHTELLHHHYPGETEKSNPGLTRKSCPVQEPRHWTGRPEEPHPTMVFLKVCSWLLGGSRNLSGGSRSHNSFQVILRCYLPWLLCWHLLCWCKSGGGYLTQIKPRTSTCTKCHCIHHQEACTEKTQTKLVSPKTVLDINFITLQILIRYRFDVLTKIWKVHIKHSRKNTGKPRFSMLQWYCNFSRWKV